MSNEIIGLHSSLVKGTNVTSNQQTNLPQNNAATENKENFSSSPTSDVNLTDTASKLRQLEAKIASQPVVDAQRVENIKKAISDGTFRVDSRKTAEKMAEFENLLASKVGDK